MKFTVDSKILEAAGVSVEEFAIILYYLAGGKEILNEKLCEDLRDRGFLKRELFGYSFHPGKRNKVQKWLALPSCTKETIDKLGTLADKLRNLFPEGRKNGGNYYWRDSTEIIKGRLATFFKRYGEKFTDEQIVEATENYVKSFNGNYQYMQLLKYFIFKDDNSQLLSYLSNLKGEQKDQDWTTNIV